MAKISISLKDVMADPDMSLTSSPFAPGKIIIKRASFRKGEAPPHLVEYKIKKGECAGRTGTVIYKGKPIPKVAACVAEKHAKE
jgi:hypothetical protein